MPNPNDEYLKAFNSDVEAAPGSEGQSDKAVSPEVAIVIGTGDTSDATTGPEEDKEVRQEVADQLNEESAAAEAANAQGSVEPATEEVADGMAPAGEEAAEMPADEPQMSPEDIQREKSWEGRLKKREAELAEREAALATKQESVSDEEAESIRQSLSEDFGPEFVEMICKLARYESQKTAVSSIGDEINPIKETLGQAISDVMMAFQNNHFQAIRDSHEDFESIIEGDPFVQWVKSQPEEKQQAIETVITSGSPGQVIKLLSDFKASLSEAQSNTQMSEPSEDELEAASAVRGAGPVVIPSRAPASQDDEYKSAWDQL